MEAAIIALSITVLGLGVLLAWVTVTYAKSISEKDQRAINAETARLKASADALKKAVQVSQP